MLQIEPKRKKRLTKEEIEERKKEEKALKNAKKELAEELKRLNPKECLKVFTHFYPPVFQYFLCYVHCII